MNRWKLAVMIPTVGILVLTGAIVLTAASTPLVVRMQDQCNPATFNAAVGPGTCVGDGTITFDHFVNELTNAQKAGAWLFDPADGTVETGTPLKLENRGGETHTFTKVANFGGGFVPILNKLSGNPVPAPECGTVTAGGIIPKPESPSNIFVESGLTEDGPTAGGPIMPSGTHQVPMLYPPVDANGAENQIKERPGHRPASAADERRELGAWADSNLRRFGGVSEVISEQEPTEPG